MHADDCPYFSERDAVLYEGGACAVLLSAHLCSFANNSETLLRWSVETVIGNMFHTRLSHARCLVWCLGVCVYACGSEF